MHILQEIPDNQLPVLSLDEVLGAGSEYDFHQLSPGLQSMPLGMEALQQLVALYHVLQDSVDLLKTPHKETQLQCAKRNSWPRQNSRWQFFLLVVFRIKCKVFSLLETKCYYYFNKVAHSISELLFTGQTSWMSQSPRKKINQENSFLAKEKKSKQKQLWKNYLCFFPPLVWLISPLSFASM